jgi:hypothetical protein
MFLRLGSLIACYRCQHFISQRDREPDGHCLLHDCETWARVPTLCRSYIATPPLSQSGKALNTASLSIYRSR